MPAKVSRRSVLAGMALLGGTVLWSSRLPGFSPTAAAESPRSAGGAGVDVGLGIADTTGEPLGAGMDGYAVAEQTTAGIRQRLFSRAVIYVDGSTGDRVCMVTVDTPLMFQSVFLEVIRRLQHTHGDTYRADNVVLQATHTHVGPGGRSGHAMVDLVSVGFRPVTFEAQVTGIVRSIIRAHDTIGPAELTLTSTELDEVGANRSHLAFERNPQEDKDANPGGIDRISVTLHISRNGSPVGLVNWYSIHGTAFGPEIHHISGDNKGYAAWSVETDAGVDHRNLDNAPFIAVFAQGTPGDITPNMGLVPHSGPGGADEKASARILGERQASATTTTDGTRVDGSGVTGRAQWVDMDRVQVDGKWMPDGRPGATGPAVLGSAFAASSQEDGGGLDFDIGLNEGERGGSPWVHQLNQVAPIPEDVRKVHEPKDMLLPMGYLDGMIQQRHIFSVWRIGGLVVVSLGFEPTTTSGRRLRQTVSTAMGVSEDAVVVQGYSCGYGHYMTTPEGYLQQDYEGGATAFGRYTLPAALQTVDRLARALASGEKIGTGQPAGDLTGIIPDSPAALAPPDIELPGRRFGDVLSGGGDVARGTTASVVFAGANPNNNVRLEDGYLLVTRLDGTVVADDSSWSTLLTFARDLSGVRTTVDWDTTDAEPGDYLVKLRGDARGVTGQVTPFEGTAKVCVV
ncbi:putative secreted protein [Corynebacterium variabile DSM 44702]|uniref:Neutral ceramidase n=1 Tax=Corynebacterium variabile (strain DSM 44702 / CIP 107183 / JCM 12073 / NCIMB 30131) TaxID=858619 RepID=G0HDW5_CORVD|nr:neutral/alkaline non-lysosomal ceramidase N-terminal domain-containing protein [Corynebacterium variabile]AEK36433.1 putative secreted protein [Corynebacterium variabile DSM 44702]